MATELKPCPFCGSEAKMEEYSKRYENGEFMASYRVSCEKCRIYFDFESRFMLKNGQPEFLQNGYEKVIEVWNRRAGND